MCLPRVRKVIHATTVNPRDAEQNPDRKTHPRGMIGSGLTCPGFAKHSHRAVLEGELNKGLYPVIIHRPRGIFKAERVLKVESEASQV